MKILFDNGVPNAIGWSLTHHEVTFARRLGWARLVNGMLMQQAEAAGFDLLLTNDNNIAYQQNLTGRKLALVVLSNPQWPMVQQNLPQIVAAIDAATPGSYRVVQIPFR